MAKVIVVYESKYGNTKLVAETIVEGVKEVSGVEAVLNEFKEVDLNQLSGPTAFCAPSIVRPTLRLQQPLAGLFQARFSKT